MLIVFEGLDGSGKTTQASLLADRINKETDKDAVIYREPGSTPLGQHIRRVLLEMNDPITPRAEVMLFNAARAQLIDQKVIPSLDAGKVVILDRFTHSTLAYQGGGKGADTRLINQVNGWATSGVKPDHTFFLDVPIDVMLNRVDGKDRFEKEERHFYEKVWEAYAPLRVDTQDNDCIDTTLMDADQVAQLVYLLWQRKYT